MTDQTPAAPPQPVMAAKKRQSHTAMYHVVLDESQGLALCGVPVADWLRPWGGLHPAVKCSRCSRRLGDGIE